ncbi:MAG: hypothetical protein LBR25_01955 [Erysipelotrichaceae bacterium]|nr:hypothetical protein [Erysipelotrichaceae bacterium]
MKRKLFHWISTLFIGFASLSLLCITAAAAPVASIEQQIVAAGVTDSIEGYSLLVVLSGSLLLMRIWVAKKED